MSLVRIVQFGDGEGNVTMNNDGEIRIRKSLLNVDNMTKPNKKKIKFLNIDQGSLAAGLKTFPHCLSY